MKSLNRKKHMMLIPSEYDIIMIIIQDSVRARQEYKFMIATRIRYFSTGKRIG